MESSTRPRGFWSLLRHELAGGFERHITGVISRSFFVRWSEERRPPTPLKRIDSNSAISCFQSDFHREKQNEIFNFISLPFELEKVVFLGFWICCDVFLFMFTLFPVRVVLSLLTLISSGVSKRIKLSPVHLYELLRMLFCLTTLALMFGFFDSSYTYHWIRNQNTLKLYVVYNSLEVFDRLCTSFGHDILDTLYWNLHSHFYGSLEPLVFREESASDSESESEEDSSNEKDLRRRIRPPIVKTSAAVKEAQRLKLSDFELDVVYEDKSETSKMLSLPVHILVALIYVATHTIVLYHLALSLHVAVNSYNTAILSLLISNNFVELKGSVFKKFQTENLFYMTCSDAVERFQLSIFLTVITLQNLNELNWSVSVEWCKDLVSMVFLLMGTECVVDWIKHCFVAKFNRISVRWYSKYKDILAVDVVQSSPSLVFTDRNRAVARRLGFVPIPLACLFVRLVYSIIPKASDFNEGAWGLAWFYGSLFLCAMTFKIFLHVLLLGSCLPTAKIFAAQSSPQKRS